jgi:hypothetical protein
MGGADTSKTPQVYLLLRGRVAGECLGGGALPGEQALCCTAAVKA